MRVLVDLLMEMRLFSLLYYPIACWRTISLRMHTTILLSTSITMVIVQLLRMLLHLRYTLK